MININLEKREPEKCENCFKKVYIFIFIYIYNTKIIYRREEIKC